MTRIYNGDGFDWTPERVAELKQLWAAGMSLGEISDRFGPTRSAIAGKVKRLHLTRSRSKQPQTTAQIAKRNAPPAVKPKTPTTTAFCFRNLDAAPKPVAPPKRQPASIPPAPAPSLVSLLDLASYTCHWPIDKGDDDTWRYCGAPRDHRSTAYCRHHQARMLDDASRQRFIARGR